MLNTLLQLLVKVTLHFNHVCVKMWWYFGIYGMYLLVPFCLPLEFALYRINHTLLLCPLGTVMVTI